MTITRFVACSLMLAMTSPAGSVREREEAFQGVQQSVRERTGKAVRWEEDQAAHEQALQDVRQLLRKPLTVDTAVQIALLNNRSLQATFEGIGLSAADLLEAATIPNPRIDLEVRIPDKPPSGTYIDYSAALDFLSIIMIPLKKRVAKDQLEATALRVADDTLELVKQVKSAFYSLQASQQLLKRFKLIVDANAASLDLAQRQHEAGNITDLALAQQQSSYSRSRLDVASTEAEIRRNREKLNLLLGLWGMDTDWQIAGELPQVPSSDLPMRGLERLAISQRLDLQADYLQVTSQAKNFGLTKSFRLVGALDFGINSERETDSQTRTGPSFPVEQLALPPKPQNRNVKYSTRSKQVMISRRKFFSNAAVTVGVTALGAATRSMQGAEPGGQASENPENITRISEADRQEYPPGEPGEDYAPVITPNGSTLPFKVVGGVKVFHLIAEEVDHEFAPGLRALCWGFNGQVHGPTIEAVEGDRVRIYVTNKLPENTSIHWHGLLVPSGMDGVAGLSQKSIAPGETYKYEFQLRQHGTHMYHSHCDDMTQIALGLMGMFIIHPRTPTGPKVDRDFVLMSSEWRVDVGTRRPVPTEMTDFNVLTFNGRAFPGTAPLVAKYGDRVRIRFGNLSPMEHHPIHLHGYSWKITEMDGFQLPESAQQPGNTVLVAVGQTRAVEFIADNPGDWAMHCHMSHHTMNQMGHAAPNLIGVRPGSGDKKASKLVAGYMTMGESGMADMGEMSMKVPRNSIPMLGAPGKHDYIDMGGMFTILKVRQDLTSYDDPGWYENPPGTLASLASNDELQRDLGVAN